VLSENTEELRLITSKDNSTIDISCMKGGTLEVKRITTSGPGADESSEKCPRIAEILTLLRSRCEQKPKCIMYPADTKVHKADCPGVTGIHAKLFCKPKGRSTIVYTSSVLLV